jgi:hypothetical protein
MNPALALQPYPAEPTIMCRAVSGFALTPQDARRPIGL